MDKYLPVLIVGAIIGIFTIAFLIAYIRMKHDKNYKEYERHMSDSQLIKRLFKLLDFHGGFLEIVIDNNGSDHTTADMGSGLNCDNCTGYRCMDRNT